MYFGQHLAGLKVHDLLLFEAFVGFAEADYWYLKHGSFLFESFFSGERGA
jgi:hypothetical protein